MEARRSRSAAPLSVALQSEDASNTLEQDAANLFFQVASRRYERGSIILASKRPFRAWGDIFGGATTAAAIIDRLIHHAKIIGLKGNSYRIRGRSRPSLIRRPTLASQPEVYTFWPVILVHFSTVDNMSFGWSPWNHSMSDIGAFKPFHHSPGSSRIHSSATNLADSVMRAEFSIQSRTSRYPWD